MGGLAFSINMVWAQIFPFVAIQLHEGNALGDQKDLISAFLAGGLVLWLVLNIVFFCTIDLNYLKTFFGTLTGAEYTCECFLKSKEDQQKWDAVFTNRLDYSKKVHEDIKVWVAANVTRWKAEGEEWFKIEMIDDMFLPMDVLAAEGGKQRRRSSNTSLREIVGLTNNDIKITTNHNKIQIQSQTLSKRTSAWRELAEELYKTRSSNHKSIYLLVKPASTENQELVTGLESAFPEVKVMLAFILEDKFGFRVRRVNWTSDIVDWGDEECRRVGLALATFIRKRKTGEHAIDAWTRNYVQLANLFSEIHGFEEFMVVLANNTLRDSIYGMAYRVSVGALLSTIDAVTDIYVISKYYQSDDLVGEANALLAMITTNLVAQIVLVLSQYRRKKWTAKVKEVVICLLFLRPAVDAYRIR